MAAGPETDRSMDTPTDRESKTLNFKVSPDFRNEFKGFAGSHGLTMTELLKEGFALVKTKRLR